jgi:hypothetical protein
MRVQVIICLLLAGLVSSCTPEEPCAIIPPEIPDPVPCTAAYAPIYHPGKMEFGRVAGLKNCRPFMASAAGGVGTYTFPVFGFTLNTYEDWGGFYADKEMINIAGEGLKLGSSPVITKVDSMEGVSFSSYYIHVDHDVFDESYRLDTTYDNYIHLTFLDTINDRLEGWFECRFILDTPPSNIHPDTVIFTECYFEAKMP